MPGSPRRQQDGFELVTRLPARAQIAALDEGLGAGTGEEAARCVLRLIELAGYRATRWTRQSSGVLDLIGGLSDAWRSRYSEDALRVLIRRWGAIRADLRPAALSLGRAAWITGVQDLARHEAPDDRATALSIAGDTADPRLGVVACGLLADPDRSVRARADQAVCVAALHLLGDTPDQYLGASYAEIRSRPVSPIPGDESVMELERCALLDALADAAWSFQSHRCRSPVLACLLLMDERFGHRAAAPPQERMRRLLAERNHPSHAALRGVLRRAPVPALRLCALRVLGVDAIADAARDRLATAEDDAEHEILLSNSHLLLDPRRAANIASLRLQESGEHAPLPAPPRRAALPTRARVGHAGIVSLIGVDTEERRAMIEPALADDDPSVRMIGCVAADPRDRADYMYDPSPLVARRAALEWSTVGVRAPSWGRPSCERRIGVALKTARSPHAWVRRVAREESARLGVDEPALPASRLQARRLAAQDPASFARLVRDMLHDPARRLDALGLIIALRQEPRFARDLSALAMGHDVDSRTRATAVRGLDGVDDPGARRAARSCLEEEDPRLRANALETHHIPVETLVELKDDANHRVRSSALRRILMPGGPGAARAHARAGVPDRD